MYNDDDAKQSRPLPKLEDDKTTSPAVKINDVVADTDKTETKDTVPDVEIDVEYMSSHQGGFTSKLPVSSIIYKYRHILGAISLVHDRNAERYGFYSWQTDPLGSNSSLTDNIDAIYRHVLAHSMGDTIDTDGMPHLFNALTRCAMFISTLYRYEEPRKLSFFADGKDKSVPEDSMVYRTQVSAHNHTPELYTALTVMESNMSRLETYMDPMIGTFVALEPYAQLNSLMGRLESTGNIYEDKSDVHLLLYYLIKYAERDVKQLKIEVESLDHFIQPFKDKLTHILTQFYKL